MFGPIIAAFDMISGTGMSKNQIDRRRKMALVSVVSLGCMGYVDYLTGYELIFSAAYLVPVSLCAWFFELRAILLMSVASGFTSWLVDVRSGHAYAQSIVQYWNAGTCFFICAMTGLILHRLRNTLDERKRANHQLQQALEELKESTAEIRKLQSGLQVICAWTKRIKVGEQWMSPDEFLRTQLRLTLTHGMSPEALNDFEKDHNRNFKSTADSARSSTTGLAETRLRP